MLEWLVYASVVIVTLAYIASTICQTAMVLMALYQIIRGRHKR